MSENFVKLLIIGDSGVGKSCILTRFVQNRFTQAFYNTIGVDFKTKQISISGKKCKLQIWDTAGQQRFRTITANYYKGAHGIMLVFDVTNQDSFKNLAYWIEQIDKNGAGNVKKILVGNKCDLHTKRMITQDQGIKFAKQNDLDYVQVSACTAANIDLVFETVTKNILIWKQDKQVKKGNSSSSNKQNNQKQVKLASQQNGSKRSRNDCCQ